LEPGGPAPNLDDYLAAYGPKSDWGKVRAHMAAQLNGEKPAVVEYQITRATGEIGYVRVQGELTRDSHGAPAKLFGTALDISESKLAELNLLAAQRIAHMGSWELDIASSQIT